MKIFTGSQIRELDKYTIEHEPIASIDLMERAARGIFGCIRRRWGHESPVVVFAGPGNNGGDALAVARLLAEDGFSVSVYLFNISGNLSDDCSENKDRLTQVKALRQFTEVTQEFDPPQLDDSTLVVDGLFGSGLNKPLTGGFASLVKYINASPAKVVSIDLPSGLMAEDNAYNVRANIVKATLTIALQQPKLSFLFAENSRYVGELEVIDIGISAEGMANTDTRFHIVEEAEVRAMLPKRNPFAHKGDMGHAMLIAGSYGMGGAAVLAARACLRSGVGKLTMCGPKCNGLLLQMSVPEAVIQFDHDEEVFSEAVETDGYDALGIGPGIGVSEPTSIALIAQLRRTQCPIVADADALNILSNHRAWLQQLPRGMVLTPHPREFDRMNGHCADSYERISKACDLAERIEGYVIVKGRYSALCSPDGHVAFNPTGNPGMATAGSGDVLTGIITALLARGCQRKEACLLGMYLHGLAGDIAAAELGQESLVAGDIVRCLPKAFKRLAQ